MKKVGIIGCGNIANVHGWVLQKMEHVSIAVACDVQEEKARCLAQQYGGEDTIVCTDWHKLCEMEVDVVHQRFLSMFRTWNSISG